MPALLYNSYLVAYIATAVYNKYLYIISTFASPYLVCFQVFEEFKKLSKPVS